MSAFAISGQVDRCGRDRSRLHALVAGASKTSVLPENFLGFGRFNVSRMCWTDSRRIDQGVHPFGRCGIPVALGQTAVHFGGVGSVAYGSVHGRRVRLARSELSIRGCSAAPAEFLGKAGAADKPRHPLRQRVRTPGPMRLTTSTDKSHRNALTRANIRLQHPAPPVSSVFVRSLKRRMETTTHG